MKFTVLILAYNYEKYVDECIQSCLNQNYNDDYQVLLIDDGSTDQTLSKAKNYEIDIRSIPNSGCEIAANHGINLSKGDYIVRVDADDVLLPQALQTMSELISDDEKRFYYSNYSVIDSYSKKIKSVKLPEFNVEEILQRGDFLATGTFYRKSDLIALGKYNEAKKNCGLENYELIINMIKNGYQGVRHEKELFLYRRHNNNLSSIKREMICNHGSELLNSYGNLKYQYNQYHPYLGKLEDV